jgi:hypothetical protein
VRFFLDNNMSPAFEAMLSALGVEVSHISRVEGLTRDAPDTVWIPVVARNKWVAVGGDGRILTRQHELACVRENGLVYFLFERQFMSMKRWDQALVVMKAWPNIADLAPGAKAGTCFAVAVPTGKVKKIDV